MLTGKQFVGLLAALIVSVPAFAAADQYLYNDGSLGAEGVLAVQQHTVYVEIIKDEIRDEEQVHQFAAVVALVKRCIKREQQFDNAVLWFNDQFLFGDKKRVVENITEAPALGYQPKEDYFDSNNNPTNDTDGTAKFIRRYGDSTGVAADDDDRNETGVPDTARTDNGAFTSAANGRWVGCFVPDGFLHAIGSDDPYAVGLETEPQQTPDAGDEDVPDVPGQGLNNVGLVKDLIALDNHPSCTGCVFNYSGSFYITDPNGFNWVIDKFVYASVISPLAAAGVPVPGDCGGVANQHVTLGSTPAASGCSAEQHRHEATDPDSDDTHNHCFDNPDTGYPCDADKSDPTDTARRDSNKVTTLEPMFSVHLQVDDDLQAIRDEAQWQWRTGEMRPGAPRYEDSPNTPTADAADGACPPGNQDPRCSIEYTALIVVDFEAFDDLGVVFNGNGEDEIARNKKVHGDGSADDGDESKSGNSHPHNPDDANTSPAHSHDAVTLDLFFMYHEQAECDLYHMGAATDDTQDVCGAPYFSTANPYWLDGTPGVDRTGAPPRVVDDPTCNTAGLDHDQGSAPLVVRDWIVCDIDGVYGVDQEFHAHDGTQTIDATG